MATRREQLACGGGDLFRVDSSRAAPPAGLTIGAAIDQTTDHVQKGQLSFCDRSQQLDAAASGHRIASQDIVDGAGGLAVPAAVAAEHLFSELSAMGKPKQYGESPLLI